MFLDDQQLKTLLDICGVLEIIIVFIVSYIIGCYSKAHAISVKKNIDFKANGSRNYGASNTLLLAGKKAGLTVLICDILKVFVANFMSIIAPSVIIYFPIRLRYLNYIDDSQIGITALFVSCLAVIIGHIYPMQLKFDGGKGFATYIGSILAISFFTEKPSLLLVIVVAIALAVITDYIVVGTFTTIILTPIYLAIAESNKAAVLCMGIASLIIAFKHIENIVNIIYKKETKISEAFSKKSETQIEKELLPDGETVNHK